MKKYGMLIVIGLLITLNIILCVGPVAYAAPVPIVIDPNTVAVKIDDDTVRLTTTTTTVRISDQDRAELQTEKDDIPDGIRTLEDEIVELNARSAEIDLILSVF